MNRRVFSLLLASCGVSACDRPSASSQPVSRAEPAASTPAPPSAAVDAGPPRVDAAMTFDDEALGSAPAALEPVVGDWTIGQASGATGLLVDGSRWRDGTPSANLADQAKRMYGDRYAEFLDGVKAFAFYPLAVQRDLPPAGDMRLSVRFYPIAGKIDQAAGIAFAIAPDGSYLGVRANALEDNLLYFKVVKGKRTVFDTVRNVPTATKTWHTLAVEVRGKKLTVQLDGAKRLEKTVEDVALTGGRVGLWSKADSQVLLDDFEVTKL